MCLFVVPPVPPPQIPSGARSLLLLWSSSSSLLLLLLLLSADSQFWISLNSIASLASDWGRGRAGWRSYIITMNNSLALRIVWFSSLSSKTWFRRPGWMSQYSIIFYPYLSLSLSLHSEYSTLKILEKERKISMRVEGIDPALEFSKYQYSKGGARRILFKLHGLHGLNSGIVYLLGCYDKAQLHLWSCLMPLHWTFTCTWTILHTDSMLR